MACKHKDDEPDKPPPLSWGFKDVTAEAGLSSFHHEPFNALGSIDAYDHGNGLAAGDFNGDGHEDLLVLTQCGPAGYFLGKGDGTFTDQSSALSMLSDGCGWA